MEGRRCLLTLEMVRQGNDWRKFCLMADFSVEMVGEKRDLWRNVRSGRRGDKGGRMDMELRWCGC